MGNREFHGGTAPMESHAWKFWPGMGLAQTMEEVVTAEEVLEVLRVPRGPQALLTAVALALYPQDPAGAELRGRELRRIVAQRSAGRPVEGADLIRELVVLHARPIQVLRLHSRDGSVSCRTYQPAGGGHWRVRLIVLLATPGDEGSHFDVVATRAPRTFQLTPAAVRPVVKVATWNVRGAAAPGAAEHIDEVLAAHGVHIAALQETRLPRQDMRTANYAWILEGAPKRGGRGVAVLVRRGLPGFRLRSYTRVQDNVLQAEVELAGLLFTVVTAHVPCDGQEGQRGTLAAMSAALFTAQPGQWKLLLGDLNAHLGAMDRAPAGDVLGPRLPHRASNAAGAAVLTLARTLQLRVVTTWRQARGCDCTWRQGGAANARPDAQHSQVDHVATNFPHIGRVRAEFVPGFSTDHKLVLEWQVAALTGSATLQEAYRAAMDAGLQTMLTHSDPLAWVHLQRVMVSAANATLLYPGSPMTPGRQAAANLYATAERRAQRHPGSLVAAAELRQAARAHHQAQGAHQAGKVRQVFAEVQGVRPAERLNAVYRYLRRRRRAGGPRPQGVTIRDWEAEVQRLAVGEQPPLLEEELDAGGPALAPAPTADQVRGYLSGMRTRTAPGPDGLPVELFQQASGLFLHHFARVLERAWEEGRFPAGWLTSAQHPIPKVARPRTTEDYRTISLCTVVYKVLAAHVLHLLQQVIPAIPFYQAGFRAQRSTADHLYVLRAVMDECWHVGRPLHVVSLDIKAAFPSVAKGKVVEVLQGYGVPHKLINRVIQLALTDLTFLRWAASSTSTVVRGKGLRQGCPLSPWLFTLVLHGAVGAVVARLPRFSLQQTNPQVFPAVLAYADDLLLLSDRFPDVDEFVVHLVRELALLHLQLNPRKCEYLLRWPGWEDPDPDPLPRPIRIGGLEMQQVESLLYLGAFISSHLSRSPIH
ncbi:LINE-1 retrotransposable element ORF2 protein [Frankliniella fusca]|uniref:LINE-1 retrotransposable element ORF2 protein n=1 Tax=Frankliniella fusca TaxID=407009 RepID=A0AAE1LDU8_9NEOP|nr:LINE-1 retrotransposable element ORF2 protein [Frankliniella fusca]